MGAPGVALDVDQTSRIVDPRSPRIVAMSRPSGRYLSSSRRCEKVKRAHPTDSRTTRRRTTNSAQHTRGHTSSLDPEMRRGRARLLRTQLPGARHYRVMSARTHGGSRRQIPIRVKRGWPYPPITGRLAPTLRTSPSSALPGPSIPASTVPTTAEIPCRLRWRPEWLSTMESKSGASSTKSFRRLGEPAPVKSSLQRPTAGPSCPPEIAAK